jgi:hypothetical protein
MKQEAMHGVALCPPFVPLAVPTASTFSNIGVKELLTKRKFRHGSWQCVSTQSETAIPPPAATACISREQLK